AAARQGMESTKEMLAKKGRSSRLGERSLGHIDPGAASSYFIIEAWFGVLVEE
ncbi:DAK2 domain-containing protein, partial [Candidatus Caldatribacterium sp.]|uniref:DAK2 domain-containing protein n=1 Tax=Candidatus Caldatribacterium sp. TaxID=2282143 RepID=UPI0038473047|nr:DAK2 domain-containing protein [Candidatus Caldatribacterium sp.]